MYSAHIRNVALQHLYALAMRGGGEVDEGSSRDEGVSLLFITNVYILVGCVIM